MRSFGILTLLLLTTGCTPGDVVVPTNAQAAPLPILEAAVLHIKPQPWSKMVRSHGNLLPDDRAPVGSKIDGRVDEVHVDLGDRVTAGTPLVTLTQAERKLRVQQAAAQLLQARSAVGLRPGTPTSALEPENAPPVLEQKAVWNEARGNLDRARQLQDRNSITAAEMEQIEASAAVAEARFRSALNGVYEKIALIGVREAELSLAEEDLANTVILAPFDGLVQEKHVSPGTYLQIGDSAMTLVRIDQLRFRGTVPERYAMKLSVGQTLQLQIESVSDPVSAQISRISPAVDPASRSLLFEALIDNSTDQLRSGLFAEARVVIDPEATAIVIPPAALIEFAGAEKVWKVVDGETQEQPVLTGERRAEGIEITQGLVPGDVILADGSVGMPARVSLTNDR
ncbi:MAG: efflux RND transporter periplasmic adaptor subunit [Planctomycetaceae bacterium]